MLLAELSRGVLTLFRDLDMQVATFRNATDLACPTGCAACCLLTRVEATALEFVPLAMHLSDAGIDRILALLKAPDCPPHCLFYATVGWPGHCRIYPWRPTVCRLFGFAGQLDRLGNPRLAACREMRAADPEAVNRAENLARGSGLMPLFREASIRLAGLDPALGRVWLPINQAIRDALLKVSLRRGYMPSPGLPENSVQAHGPLSTEFRDDPCV